MELVALLRRRTRAHHARLDAGIDFSRGDVTHARYAAFLRGILSVVTPLEPVLARWLGGESGPSRAECLRADLASLGVSAKVEDVAVRLPHNTAEAYGCAYVLEGSTLGGLVLAPMVEERFGPSAAVSYLRLRGSDTGRAWRAWLRRLEAFAATANANDVTSACDMACATFEIYTTSLLLTGALTEACECSR